MAYCRFAILQYAIVHDISNYFLSSLIKVSVFNSAKELVPEFSGTSSFVIYRRLYPPNGCDRADKGKSKKTSP